MSSNCHTFVLLLICCWKGIDGKILSRNRPVCMSSQYENWSGGRVVDGNYSTGANDCGCCAATTSQTDPWITIDLGNTYLITRISVYSRTDQDNQDLNGLVFKLDDTSFTPTTDSTPTPILSYTFILDRPTAARNVTLMLPGENRLLVLCEYDVADDNIITTNKPVTTSSTLEGPQGALDGDTRTDATACQCCAATTNEDNPWLRVDLGGYFYITYIIIYGRTDDNHESQRFDRLEIDIGKASVITVTNTTNYYDSGALRVGPATYIELKLIGTDKTLVVCELQVFGECADGYTRTDTLCKTACVDGIYGHNCIGVCGHCKNGAICNKTNGVCDQCEDGYMETDMLCVEPCTDATYGHNCTSVCGHCKNGAICNKTNGVCDKCEDGYMETDMLCVEPCINGTYGDNCTGVCGRCKNGAICNKTNGVCDQCEDGYMETDMLCVERAENVSRPLPSCPTYLACPNCPDIMMIVGVTVAAMLAIEGAAVVVICLVRKRKSLRKDNVGEHNPYELPDRSINEDEHQYDSAMDMSVETPNYVNTVRRAL